MAFRKLFLAAVLILGAVACTDGGMTGPKYDPERPIQAEKAATKDSVGQAVAHRKQVIDP